MYGQLVTLAIAPEHADAVRPILRANALASRQEPGCRRFDLISPVDAPATFLFYEIFDNKAALKAHHQTAHFKAVADALNALPEGAVTRSKITFTDLTDP